MNKPTHLLLVLFLLCLPLSTRAQQEKDDNNKYLAGAVPEVNGKVLFSEEYQLPGMSEEQIYEQMLKWLTAQMKERKNESRVVYSDKASGTIAGMGSEWLIFKSSALSLDRALINYQISITCQPEKCLVEIERIKFIYQETEKYAAEEWITDKYALNKNQTKLVRGLAKFRKKTVDFAHQWLEEAAKALGQNSKSQLVVSQKGTPTVSVAYKEVAPNEVPTNAIQMGAGKLVIAIGTDNFNKTLMTANAGGSIGKIAGKPVVFTILSPDQPYEQMEKAETYSVKFYPTGENEPTVILECKRMPSQAPQEGQPHTYIGEIVKAQLK